MNLETYIVALVPAGVLVLFSIFRVGLPSARWSFGEKTYWSVEGTMMLWGTLATMAGVSGWAFSLALDITSGARNGESLTDAMINSIVVAALTAAAAGGILQWARLRAAFRKEQRSSLRVAQDS
ncbi:hypothetical protein [Paenarthrobacter sp. YIM B13468]|uniref:hypothetical protein n=1 Tax=Paenarthrobacter sp. YIM B13468 TaxID=3366295 RepID=UPI003672E9E2